MMRRRLWMSFVVVMGCADGSALDEPVGVAPAFVTGTGEHEQGRPLLGELPDSLASIPYFRVSATPMNRTGFQLSVTSSGSEATIGTHLVATGGSSTYTGMDSWFIGLVMDGGAGRRLRIVSSVSETVGGRETTLYFVEYQATAGAAWIDYCGAEVPAIALAGYYGDHRIHHQGPWISFGCPDGVAHKCVSWGYHPGNGGAGASPWDHHQACTAMANADYCRDGQPHTLDATPIQIRDFTPVTVTPYPDDIEHPEVWPGDPDRFYFEAAWRPGALVPICLSKLRWSMLAPHACADALPDPRYSALGAFCDDVPVEELQSKGGLLISASMMMDAPLLTWRNPTTDDVATTIRGYSTEDGGSFQWIPFPGYSEYLGVDSVILRHRPSAIPPSDLVALYRQHNAATADVVLGTAAALPGYTVGAFEGYAFRDRPARGAPRALQVCRIGSDHRTTVAPPPGCIPVATLGWAMLSP